MNYFFRCVRLLAVILHVMGRLVVLSSYSKFSSSIWFKIKKDCKLFIIVLLEKTWKTLWSTYSLILFLLVWWIFQPFLSLLNLTYLDSWPLTPATFHKKIWPITTSFKRLTKSSKLEGPVHLKLLNIAVKFLCGLISRCYLTLSRSCSFVTLDAELTSVQTKL